MSSARRVSLEPAYLLHHYPWRDTSRILEVLTRTHGRVSLVARGSRQSAASRGGALQPFTALLVSFTVRGEMGYLNAAERAPPAGEASTDPPAGAGDAFTFPALAREKSLAQRAGEGHETSAPTHLSRPAGEVARSAGEASTDPPATAGDASTSPALARERSLAQRAGEGPATPLSGTRLMSGYYANELLLKLLQRNDPHPALFDAYAALLAALHLPAEDPARPLRIFEKRLLEELGWGLNLEHEAASGAPLEPGRSYRYHVEGGAEPVDGVAEGTLIFCGASLLSLAGERLADPRSLGDARRLLRAALDRLLDGRALRTREVLLEMRAHAGGTDAV